MSVLTKIRNRTGLLLTLVAGGIGLFIIQDGLTSLLKAGGGNVKIVGEIAGEDVSPEEFDQEYKQIMLQYEMNSNGQGVNEYLRNSAREQAWNELIFKKAYQAEFEELGIQVTDGKKGERVDMVQGHTLHTYVIQQFKNDSTGEFDRGRLITTLQNFKKDENSRFRWELFERAMVKDRIKKKYENLLSKSNYVTEAEAKKRYAQEESRVSFDYLYVPYSQIVDSTISTTDSELTAYMNANKNKYEGKDAKTIEYISFEVKASEADEAEIKKQIEGLAEAFKTEVDGEAFSRLRSDKSQDAKDLTKEQLPIALQSDSSIAVGNVYGPFLEGNVYNVYKVIEEVLDSTQSAQASHILFKKEDKAKAEEILAEATSGADFAELAKQYGTDGTKDKGGDLGEFQTGAMVAPFQAAVFSAKELGVLSTLTETQFGYHIIKVTKLAVVKDIKTKYKVATLNKELVASRQTRNNVYRDANLFLQDAKTLDAFKANAKEKGLEIQVAENVGPTSQNVKTLSKAREIVQWAYREAEVNQISNKVFELRDANTYVVAVVTASSTKDEVSLTSVKSEVKNAYLKEKKAEKLVTEVKELSGTLAEKKQKLVDEKQYTSTLQQTATGVTLQSPYVSGVGEEPVVVSTAFGLAKDTESGVLKGDNGIFIVKTTDVSNAREVADYTSSKTKVLDDIANADTRKINDVIKENASIKDYRYIVY